jgi:hypothetical protein
MLIGRASHLSKILIAIFRLASSHAASSPVGSAPITITGLWLVFALPENEPLIVFS